ncbi:hypothetical protein F0562_025272 [Nyssa sinensis]|uniref:Glycosyltransferase 61 catalytic domain-containing protein n=1 Tax=Nyssa sinensis TaxID=561372 RepID=A0A5J5BF35_9ASTE|nr:hypothetical protein F0562_025272 [Nyssa sinensis]
MTYDTIFARSFSRHEQKKLGLGALIGCLIIALSFCIVFKPYLGPIPVCFLFLCVLVCWMKSGIENAVILSVMVLLCFELAFLRVAVSHIGFAVNLQLPLGVGLKVLMTEEISKPQQMGHHKELSIDPSKSLYSMKDFRQFLRCSYSLKRDTAIKLRDVKGKRPRLLIISRRRSRRFMNEGKIAEMAKSLGFDVVVKEADSNLSQFAQVVNSCDVMMGVHGAGLTNIVFLPENAVLIQVVPMGGMEWLARTDFGEPAKHMNLRYLEYKIGEKESSLIQQYPIDHPVFRDPTAIHKHDWSVFRSIYLDKQNVNLDMGRFRATLLEALELLQM